jgi:hypothetical protein
VSRSRGEAHKKERTVNFWNKLFSKTPTLEDIKVQLKEVEREQKKKRRDLEVKEAEKNEKIKEAMAAKRAGKQEMLRDVFRELRQMEIDNGHLNTDLRRLSLSKTALASFSRKVEMLARKKDRKSLENLVVRFKESSLQKAIDKAEVDDDTFNDMLEDILGDEEMAVTASRVKEDAGFEAFDSTLNKMIEAEKSGTEEEDLSKFQEDLAKAIKAEKVRDA